MCVFEPVYNRWRPYVLVCLIHHVPEDELDDALQEVFLRVWRHLPQYQERPTGTLQAWLATIARNYLIDRARRIATRPQSAAAIREEDVVAECAEPSEVETYLAVLNPRQREIVRLMLDGYNVPEIATMLHTTRLTVKSAKARGFKRLREALKGPLST